MIGGVCAFGLSVATRKTLKLWITTEESES